MAKCGGCGRFLPSAATDGAICSKCKLIYHRECVAIPAGSKLSAKWACPACKIKVPKTDNSLTPVKPLHSDEEQSLVNVSPVDGAIDDEGDIKFLCREMRALRKYISFIKGEVEAYKKSLDFLSDKVDTLEERVVNLEKNSHCREETSAIEELRVQLRERDQWLLLNDLEISGVTEVKEENRTHLITLISKKLGVELDKRDVVSVERVGSLLRNRTEGDEESVKPRLLAVRLARRCVRDELLQAARVRRGATTDGLQLPGAPRRFYVNELLTQYNRQLFAKAREAGRTKAWKFVWTRRGRVYARREHGQPVHKISSEVDIHKVFME